MRLLFLGDIVGRPGRDAVKQHMPRLKDELTPDIIIINGENAAHGFGITGKITEELLALGADVVTTGNHVWDQRDVITTIAQEPRLLRPANYPATVPGKGSVVIETTKGKKVLVINLMARLFMETLEDPFKVIEHELKEYKLGANIDAIFVDFHGEATSEKYSMGHFLDGRVSMVVGTHTHVPTADAHVLAGGTAFQSDAGMCGDYDSVIGMKKEKAMSRFLGQFPKERLEPADGEGTVCGVLVQLKANGLAEAVHPIRLGPGLSESMPT